MSEAAIDVINNLDIYELCKRQKVRWFIGDFALTLQYLASSLSVNCHDGQFHRLPTISLHLVCQ